MPGWGEGFWGEEFWGAEFVRQQSTDDVQCRYVVFFDGLPIAYSTDTGGTGTILGNGVGTWIGNSESVLFGVETLGQRTVKPGLILPETIEFGGDPKGLGLDRSTLTLKIVDADDTVAALFATEGVVPDILRERIAPGMDNLGTAVDAIGPGALTGTLNPRGKWIGLERIGPNGERRMFPAIPFGLVGYDHQGDVGDRLPPVPISTTPVIHAGRMVTLYRIYADPSVDPTDSDRWFTWDQAHAAGDLVWMGVMQDSGTYEGNRVWSIDCYGPESLLEKGLGQVTVPTAYPISAELEYTEGVDDQIFIQFAQGGNRLEDAGPPEVEGRPYAFEGTQWKSLTSITKQDLHDEIDGYLKDTAAGIGTDYDTAEDFYDAWDEATDHAGFNCGLNDSGFYIRKNETLNSENPWRTFGIMRVAMHRRVWQTLGFEPGKPYEEGGQDVPDEEELEDTWGVYFRKLHQGDDFTPGFEIGGPVPGEGYYLATFTTAAIGSGTGNNADWFDAWDNEGNERYYKPIFSGTQSPVVINQEGGQQVSVNVGTDSPFWEPQPTVPRTSEANINGTDTELARWFVMRGKIRVAEGSSDDGTFVEKDEEDRVAVCSASWRQGDHYGEVSTGGGLGPQLFIQEFHSPLLFGWPHKKLKHDWVATVGTDDAITIAPLNAYTFGHGTPIEWAHLLLGVLLLSTGTSEGFSAPLSEGGTLDLGLNQPAGLTSTGDVELADLGLGIPKQLVADYSAITAEFAKVSGGLGGDLNRMRLCYAGPFESRDALEAILKPRRMAVGLHGKKFGVYRYEQFSPSEVDVTITEDDLYGEPGDPTSVIPRQVIRAHGAVDGALIHYGFEPGGTSKLEHRQKALDYNARWRRGDLVEELNGRGLIPTDWLQGTSHQGKNWKLNFLEEWGRRAPAFFSKRHFIIEDLKVSRPKGQDLMPGTRVLLSNPWPLAPDGTYGLNNRLGRVIGVSINTRHHYTTARVLVYGDVGFPPHFAPFVFITDIASDVLTYDKEGLFTGYPINECETEKGWTRPAWTTNSAEGVGRLWYQGPTGTWVAGGTGTVESIDTAAGTITLAAPLSSEPPPNTYTMMFVFDDYETNADTWVEDAYAPITNYAGLYNTGGTDRIGKKWLD